RRSGTSASTPPTRGCRSRKRLSRRPPSSPLVGQFLGFQIPLLALADGRAQLPARRLWCVVDRLAQGGHLGARVVADRALAADVDVRLGELRVEILLEDVEVAGRGPPPA